MEKLWSDWPYKHKDLEDTRATEHELWSVFRKFPTLLCRGDGVDRCEKFSPTRFNRLNLIRPH